ncbi:cAMP-dependent protein kinase catalytic subunit PRKX-like [Daphnia pulex]|uniref:cAMP-dependent protein kinase catalytic subunit PRKX-like n=1 Tax=Daphnia pulex TaxID=6669 RepID=UPI001EE102A8|nr:cAMP-dependent protein kinase catalytic subunit PRKX-like [Daphnia pulex]
MVTKFKKSNNKDKYFDRKIIPQIFAHEDKDEWRYFALEPYISTLYDYCRCDGQYKGPTLLSKSQVIDQMISGIKYLHNLEYPHGDLNPLNIIISRDGRIKLSDFGLSKLSYTKSNQPDNLSIQILEIC